MTTFPFLLPYSCRYLNRCGSPPDTSSNRPRSSLASDVTGRAKRSTPSAPQTRAAMPKQLPQHRSAIRPEFRINAAACLAIRSEGVFGLREVLIRPAAFSWKIKAAPISPTLRTSRSWPLSSQWSPTYTTRKPSLRRALYAARGYLRSPVLQESFSIDRHSTSGSSVQMRRALAGSAKVIELHRDPADHADRVEHRRRGNVQAACLRAASRLCVRSSARSNGQPDVVPSVCFPPSPAGLTLLRSSCDARHRAPFRFRGLCHCIAHHDSPRSPGPRPTTHAAATPFASPLAFLLP